METATMERNIIARRKDLNARGNGTQETRRVRMPDGTTGWASDLLTNVTGSWSSGTFYAADRRCKQTGEAPVGTIVVSFESSLRGGQKTGPAQVSAGIVRSVEESADAKIEWVLSYRRRGNEVEVQVDGAWLRV